MTFGEKPRYLCERIGRNIAEYMGLSVTGTLGILLKTKQKGKIDSFADYVTAMQKNGIHYNTKLVEKLALQAGEILLKKTLRVCKTLRVSKRRKS